MLRVVFDLLEDCVPVVEFVLRLRFPFVDEDGKFVDNDLPRSFIGDFGFNMASSSF